MSDTVLREPLAPAAAAEASEEKAVIGKVFRRLIWFCFALYIVAYLDRINIGYAALTMNKDLGLTATMFGFANTLFYTTYMLFEIPSNLLLVRFGARRWIARIMITWGLASAATMFVVGPNSLYFVRALVGLAEAGFVPGMLLYLSLWFPTAYRARVMSVFMTAMPVTMLIGSPLSGVILQMHGALGIAGWRWLFLIEAVPSILLGLVALRFLTDRPADAPWLTANERATLERSLARDAEAKPSAVPRTMLQELGSATVLLLCLAYFCLVNSLNTFATWSPQIIRDVLGGNAMPLAVGLVGAIPPIFTILGMVLFGANSDRTGDRLWHTIFLFAVAALGWTIVVVSAIPDIRLAGLILVSVGAFTGMALFWAFCTPLLTLEQRPASIALISTAGILGSATSPTIVGFLRDLTHSFSSGLWYAVGLLVVGILTILIVSRTGPKHVSAY
ncbi:MAG: MFS transporter [Methylobacteriaceae bacterium]|nr:MFS transporter [Methylobacteriaceae bacterium]